MPRFLEARPNSTGEGSIQKIHKNIANHIGNGRVYDGQRNWVKSDSTNEFIGQINGNNTEHCFDCENMVIGDNHGEWGTCVTSPGLNPKRLD